MSAGKYCRLPANAARVALATAPRQFYKPLIYNNFYSLGRWPDDCRSSAGYPETSRAASCAQSTSALALVGATVVVDGSTTQLTGGKANWNLNVTKPATATVTIKDATGQTAYTSSFAVNPGTQNFTWDGHGINGTMWPDGAYTMTATATDASGQTTAISTQIQAKVDSVDLTQTPPLLSINGQNYTAIQLQKIVAP